MCIVKNALTKTNICRRLFMDTLKHFPNLIMCYRYQLFAFRSYFRLYFVLFRPIYFFIIRSFVSYRIIIIILL